MPVGQRTFDQMSVGQMSAQVSVGQMSESQMSVDVFW